MPEQGWGKLTIGALSGEPERAFGLCNGPRTRVADRQRRRGRGPSPRNSGPAEAAWDLVERGDGEPDAGLTDVAC